MAQIFRVVLSLSVSGGLVGLLILLLRPVSRRVFAKKWTYYIWLLVLVRLMVPVHVDLNMMEQLAGELTVMGSRWEKAGSIPDRNHVEATPENSIKEGEPASAASGEMPGEDTSASVMPEENSPESSEGMLHAEQKTDIFLIASIVWILGILISAAWRLYSYRSFVREIRTDCVPVTGEKIMGKSAEIQIRLKICHRVPIYESESVDSPMLIGVMRPFIVLPSNFLTEMNGRENEVCLILHHELVHYKRRDIWYKWLFQGILCIHWFNPLLYLFNRKFNIDCELACDEMVMELLTEEGRKAYGDVLLDVADRGFREVPSLLHKHVPAMTLLEEKRTLKQRLQGIARYHKKGIVIGICSMAALAVLATAAVICGVSGIESYAGEMLTPSIISDASFNDILSPSMHIRKSGDAYRMYDDDTLIAGDCESDVWRAQSYRGGGNSIDCHKFVLNGSDILWIVYADKDTTLEMTSSFALKGGRFKVVQVMPDQTVKTLNENGEKTTEEVALPKGRNCFKIVGQEARLEDFNITYGRVEKDALNGIFRSEAEEYAYQVKTGQEPYEPSRLGEICIYLEGEEISELCRSAWETGAVLSDQNWQDVFIYSDDRVTVKYLLEALQAGKVEEFDSRILCTIVPYMNTEDISECFRYLLERGKVAESDWENIFIYSDAELSSAYLVKALQNGKGSGFSGKTLEQIGAYTTAEDLTDIVLALDQEQLSYEDLQEYAMPYLDAGQIRQCLFHYIDLGNALTDSQLRDISAYASEKDFYRIVEYNGKNK